MLRASGLTDGSSNALIQSVTYGVADELTGLQNLAGISGGQPNYYQETRTYNSRFQLTRLTAIMPTNYANSRIDIGYTYSATQNNGQITQEKNWISGEEVNYAYDALNRLITAQTTGPQWGLSWSYDGFGNRTSQTVTKGSGPAASLAINAANNRITTSGYGYDSNGNLTQMPGQTSVFDIENRLGSASGSFGAERYGYDPSNQRVYKKKPDGSEEFYLYGASGELVETFKIVTWAPWVAPAAVETRVYFGGRVVRYVDPQAKSERAIWVDRVGSMRLKAGFDNGNFSAVQPQNYPYGENRTPGTDRFATYFRDSSTGLDYAMNRYYGSNLGRFLTPDPFDGSAKLQNPQSWNRYAYVNDDPINQNDPSGLGPEEYWGPPSDWFQSIARSTMLLSSYGFMPNIGGPDPMLDVNAAFARAGALLSKDNCQNFLLDLVSRSLIESHDTDRPVFGPTVAEAIMTAVDKASKVTMRQEEKPWRATARFGNPSGTITFYQGFWGDTVPNTFRTNNDPGTFFRPTSLDDKGRTIIHEGLHLLFAGASDALFGELISGKPITGTDAERRSKGSGIINKALEEHCNGR